MSGHPIYSASILLSFSESSVENCFICMSTAHLSFPLILWVELNSSIFLLILGCSFKRGWLPQSLGSHFWSLPPASSTWSCMLPSYKLKTWVKWMQLDCQLSSQFFSSYEYLTLLSKICKLFNFCINKSNSQILSWFPFLDSSNVGKYRQLNIK